MSTTLRPLAGLLLGLGLLAAPGHPVSYGATPPGPIPDAEGGDVRHPLDPLTAEEIARAVEVLRAAPSVPPEAAIPLVVLREPPKAEVLAFTPGAPFARVAFAVLLDRPTGRTFEARVDLNSRALLELRAREGVQPAVFGEEYAKAAELVRRDERWRAAMRRRGLRDEQFEQVSVDGWAPGPVDRPDLRGARLLRAVSYLRGESANPYSRVVEGVIALVNLTRGEVVDVLDEGDVPIPPEPSDYFDPAQIGPLRDPLRPLEARLPEGANFTLRGHEVRWQKWSLRYGFHPRDGLVIHAVAYDDDGDGPAAPRRILYRGSLSEMVVPYADPSEAWRWRNAFDVGEYGLGTCSTRIRAGREVPEHALVLPAVLTDDLGRPAVREGALAIYEQDGGLLWSHTDGKSRRTETRRAHQLVLHSLYTVGNYDYGLRWVFGQDGAIDVEVELTGVVLSKGLRADGCLACEQPPDAEGRIVAAGEDRHGSVVGPHVLATHHQHLFNFRLDLDVESDRNEVREVALVPDALGPANPHGNAFVAEQRVVRSEREGGRDLDPRSQRTWKVLNPNRRTALGHFPAYELMPGPHAPPLAAPDASVRRRARFVDHPVWVTRHDPDELYAAGDYPNQSTGGDGLPRYLEDDAPLVDADVVLWHTMGLSHAARAEEWPVMPVSRAHFRLVPHHFFDRNPALDVR